MNLVIKKLAELARIDLIASEGLGGGGYIENANEIQEFVKLIIKEIGDITWTEEHNYSDLAAIHWNDNMRAIKLHFGIALD